MAKEAGIVNDYLTEGQVYPKFSREEERRLAEQVVAGRAAREQLILSQIPWAIHLVRKWAVSSEEADEMIAEAMRWLPRAVDKFDPTRGKKLSTYTWHWIFRARSELHRRQVRATPPGSRVPLEPLAVEPEEPDLDPQGLDTKFVVWALNLVQDRFGLRDRQICEWRITGLTLDAIGEKLGLTRERVRQIWLRDRETIRKNLPKDGDGAIS